MLVRRLRGIFISCHNRLAKQSDNVPQLVRGIARTDRVGRGSFTISEKLKAILSACCLWCPLSVFALQQDVIFWHSMAGQLGEEVNRLAQQFNDSQTTYRVKPIYKGDYMESLTSFAAAFRAKHPPNLIQVFEVGTSVMHTPKGIIKPVEQLMHEQGMDLLKEHFFPAVLRQYSLDGVLLAMPFNVSIPVMFYNADALRKFGVTPYSFPSTWGQFELLAKRLHQAGFSCVYTSAYPAWILIESYQALQGLNLEKTAEVLHQQLGRHLQRIRQWQQKHYFEYGGRGDDATALFTRGKCPIFSQSSGAYVGLSELVPFHLGVAPIPLDDTNDATRHNNVVGGAALWVPAGQSQEMEHGIALFLAFLSQPNVQQAWYEHTGYLPMDNIAPIPQSSILRIAQHDLNRSNQMDANLQQGAENQVRVIHDQMLEAIFSGMMTVEKALHKAEIRIQHVLKRFKKNTRAV